MQLKEVKNAAISITLKWLNTLLSWGIDFLFKLASTSTTMHQSYEYKLGHPADFRVKYRFYSTEEGGCKALPFQGLRSDFWYEHDNHEMSGVFMIWPEFEDDKGEVILKGNEPVSLTGTARMWIINKQLRPYHQKRINVGTKDYFMEGKRTAECEVIEIFGLHTNPINNTKSNG